MTRPTRPMPVRPCRTYVYPQVTSLRKYGSRAKNGVRILGIMTQPVTMTAAPTTRIARWYSRFPSGYLPGFGPSTSCPSSRRISALNSGMSRGPTQIDQKSSQKVAWMMWYNTDAVSTRPATQCQVTHGN